MMYLLLNLGFFIMLGIAYLVIRPAVNIKALAGAILLLTILTIIFDNLIIAAHIVAYHQAQLIGWYIGRMPIEDLSYTVAACLLVPVLWGREVDDVE